MGNYGTKVNSTNKIKYFLLIGMSSKKCSLYYGPILTHILQVFKAAEKILNLKAYGASNLRYGTIVTFYLGGNHSQTTNLLQLFKILKDYT